MKSYLIYTSSAFLLILAAALNINYWIDPYGLYHESRPDEPKPHAGNRGALVKPYRVLDFRPRTVILGNSRAEVGFNPDDALWPKTSQPVYNLSLPGSGIGTARRLLQHVASTQPPKLIILCVDFLDFLVTPEDHPAEPELADRLLTKADGTVNNHRWLAQWRDHASTLASLGALGHSFNTLRVRNRQEIKHLTAAGFNPMREYHALARQEGYFALFRQKDIEYFRSGMQRPRNLYARGTNSSSAFDDFAAILRLAESQGSPVHVVIYPYHARLLEIFRLVGLDGLFEEWKHRLLRKISENAIHMATVWDFSGYHAYAQERVPGAKDRTTIMQWYWEAGHFKSELGHRMLDCLFGVGDDTWCEPLTAINIASRQAKNRLDGERYRAEHHDELAFLLALKE